MGSDNPSFDDRSVVELIYALPDSQLLIEVDLDEPMTVRDVIDRSGIVELYPELIITDDDVGIFSKKTTLSASVKKGDRVEIYRPLLSDPKVVRRRKAKQK